MSHTDHSRKARTANALEQDGAPRRQPRPRPRRTGTRHAVIRQALAEQGGL